MPMSAMIKSGVTASRPALKNRFGRAEYVNLVAVQSQQPARTLGKIYVIVDNEYLKGLGHDFLPFYAPFL